MCGVAQGTGGVLVSFLSIVESFLPVLERWHGDSAMVIGIASQRHTHSHEQHPRAGGFRHAHWVLCPRFKLKKQEVQERQVPWKRGVARSAVHTSDQC